MTATKTRLRWPTFLLTATQRSRRSWTSWSLTRTMRRTARAERRLRALQLETDHQLLRLKELEQRRTQLLHRQLEMREAQEFRQGTWELTAPTSPTELQALLGVGVPPPRTRW